MEGVLGLSLGTRIIGVAVIIEDELVDWRVKSFKEQWSKTKQRAIISAIEKTLDNNPIGTVICKEIPIPYCSTEVHTLVKAVRKSAHKRGISFIPYSLNELGLSSVTRKTTKQDVIRYTIHKHPFLKRHYQQEQKNTQQYYTKMFEAIALAEGYIRNH